MAGPVRLLAAALGRLCLLLAAVQQRQLGAAQQSQLEAAGPLLWPLLAAPEPVRCSRPLQVLQP